MVYIVVNGDIMYIRLTLNENVEFEKKNVFLDDLLEVIKDNPDLEYYSGVRYVATILNSDHTKELFVRYDSIIECKISEIRLNHLSYIQMRRAKWESDSDLKTTLRVSKITRNHLKRVGSFGDSYEDKIYILLNEYSKNHDMDFERIF